MQSAAQSSPWLEVYRRFNPERPVSLSHPEWRAGRPYSPLPDILARLQLAEVSREPARILLLGTKGTGKTTELRLLADQRQPRDFVLLLDLVQLFERVVKNPSGLYKIRPWEVYYLAGLSLYQAAVERIAMAWDPTVLAELEAAWRAVAGQAATDAAPAKLDLSKLAIAVFKGASVLLDGGAVLGTVGELVEKVADAGFHWNLPLGKDRAPVDDSLPELRRLVQAVDAIIQEIQLRHRDVLLVIDGLDRIAELAPAKALFVDSHLLSGFPCNVVLCGPFILRHHPAVAGALGFTLKTLVNEPVLQRDAPSQLGPGYAFFRELFHLRVRDLFGDTEPLSDALLRQLAYHSGGRARDFVRLIREVAGRMLLKEPAGPAQAVPASLVAEVVDEARRNLEMGLYDVHINLLKRVLADPTHTLPHDEATWPMLETFRLLPYPNEHEWFYPHTLLLKRLS